MLLQVPRRLRAGGHRILQPGARAVVEGRGLWAESEAVAGGGVQPLLVGPFGAAERELRCPPR
eukprot:13166158-Alexandrium_andersonii.AAC.1